MFGAYNFLDQTEMLCTILMISYWYHSMRKEAKILLVIWSKRMSEDSEGKRRHPHYLQRKNPAVKNPLIFSTQHAFGDRWSFQVL